MEKEEQIDKIKKELNIEQEKIKTLEEFKNLKVKYLGKKGAVTQLSKIMREIPNEEKQEFGKKLNQLKEEVIKILDNLEKNIRKKLLEEKIEKEVIDITLPAVQINSGIKNPIEKITEEIEELFISMGYDVVEGPELEKDLYNFEMLNLPKGHPARDAQDTFYIENEKILLRTQTSPVQVRTMLDNKEKNPIRILSSGKTYRRDDDDASHSHQFTQIEGLYVDLNISLADLKGTMDIFAKKIFGKEVKTRFRPSYYPFTEPSVAVDVSCHKCKGKGCNVCKNTGWVTILGAGMVHPNVLRDSGYDHEKYTGFAFGMGVERIAMLKYGINDIRTFYTNDIRTIQQFDKIGGDNNEN